MSAHRATAHRRWTTLLTVSAMLVSLVALPSAAQPGEDVSVIVREVNPDTATAELAITQHSGRVVDQLPLIGGFSATLPATALKSVVNHASVLQVTPNVELSTLDDDDEWDDDDFEEFDDDDDYQWRQGSGVSLDMVTEAIGAQRFWYSGYNGSGVDVAVIDTGIAPVNGLDRWGKLLHGPDLSFDSNADSIDHLDGNGHGTHMAGIIAGDLRGWRTSARGVAYGARVVNVKIGDHDGAVDVSQTIAAIDWVVQNRRSNGMNIRVINLSYGTDSLQDPRVDPLSFAVEQAWRAGIVVVVAAGNDGNAAPLRNPATNPYVIAVGATDTQGTVSLGDDVVTDFSNCGVGRTIDLVAPGRSIASLRVPNSVVDIDHPDARVGSSLLKGSGTSQAAAVVSGAAALIIDQRPDITPDQLKALLTQTAHPLSGSTTTCQGAGSIDLSAARWARTPRASQSHAAASGGSLDQARGSMKVEINGVELSGEQDIFGEDFDSQVYASAAAQGTTWSDGDWNGTTWTGTTWSGTTWSGTTWSGTTWSGTTWSNLIWSSLEWLGTTWSGTTWSGTTWSGVSWSGNSWNNGPWSGQTWG